MSLHDLPAVNGFLNGLSAVFLGSGYYFIRRQKQIAHRNCMIAAVSTSTLFLASYLTYHFTVKTITHFRDPAWFKPIYMTILLTHTALAATILPLVVITLNRALKGRFDSHKKIARWTWPLWMYVSVTGVIIYLLLYQIFPQK
jgi:putative membrane protein